MKIAIDCRYLGKSGIGTFLENILDEMINAHPENEYLLISSVDLLAYSDKSYVQILRTNIQPLSWKELLRFPVKRINQCDVYFTPYINIPGGITIPIYSVIHDLLFFDVKGLTSVVGSWIRKWYYRRALALSTSIFTVSEFSRSRIEAIFNTKKEIHVIYNIVSQKIKNIKTLPRKKKNNIVFVGNIKKHKGIKILIDAFVSARSKGLNATLVIVGKSEMFRTHEDFSTFVENPHVKFTGYISDSELYKLIASSKLLVQPSVYEGFGLPPIESLYLGTNVLVSDIPVFKEVYAGLPVSYFHSGDSADLERKLLRPVNSNLNLEEVRRKIDERYDITEIVDRIFQVIGKNVKK